MAAALIKIPLIVERGVDVSRLFLLRDANRQPIDLTGCDATAHLCSGLPDSPGAILLEASIANSRVQIVGDPKDGTLRWSVERTATATLPLGACCQELFVIMAGRRTRVFVRHVQVVQTGGLS